MFVTLLLFLLAGFLLVDPLLLEPAYYLTVSLGILVLAILDFFKGPETDRELFLISLLVTGTSLMTACLSGNFWNPFEYSVVLGSFCICFCVLGRFERGNLQTFVVLFFGLVGGYYSMNAMVGFLDQVGAFGWVGLLRFPSGAMVNPNTSGRILGFCGLVVLVIGKNRWGSYLVSIPMLILSVMTGSRGVAVSLVIIFGIFLLNRYQSQINFKTTGLIVLLLLILIAFLIGSPVDLTNYQRIQLIPESIDIFFTYPFTGIGPWNFGMIYPQFSIDSHWQRHPHNAFLFIATSFGIAGLVVLVFCIWLGILDYSYVIDQLPILFFLVHEMVDTMLWIPGILLMGCLYCGYLWSPKRMTTVGQSVMILFVSILLVPVLLTLNDALQFRQGIVEAREGNWNKSIELWKKGSASYHRAHLAVAYLRKEDEIQAIENVNEAIESNAFDPHYYRIKAFVLKKLGSEAAAKRAEKNYLERDPKGMMRVSPTDMKDRSNSISNNIDFEEIWDAPLSPDNYLPFIKQSVKEEKCDQALRQATVLGHFNRKSLETKQKLARLFRKCDTIKSPWGESSHKNVETSSLDRRTVRPQFHEFFYRREGLDHVYKQ